MDLSVLKVTTAKKNQFYKKGIYNVDDLLKFLPRKYYDFRNPKTIKDLIPDEIESVIGTVIEIKESKNKTMLQVVIQDSNNWKMNMVFFHYNYIIRLLEIGSQYLFYGKVVYSYGNSKWKQINNPIFNKNIDKLKKIIPVYSKIQGMSDDYLKEKIKTAISITSKDEYLDLEVLDKFNLIKTYEMSNILHNPKNFEDLDKAQKRLVFDELFKFSLITQIEYANVDDSCDIKIDNVDLIQPFLDSLSFKLTEGENSQMSVINNIIDNMKKGKRTQSLVQGDVGCGKTLVALVIMLAMASNDYQSVLMAPTTVLARQHYEEISERLEPFGIKCAFLGGKLKVKEKREQLRLIESGEAKIIIGTHSVISDSVKFNNLGLTIVDEEHRFGVAQRKLLEEKTSKGIHSITMSATPIPRSLAMTIYGEFINVYTIKAMPNGRKPVKTTIETNYEKSYDFMYEEIKKGHQCYVVCPLIEESEAEKMIDIQSTSQETDSLNKYFKGKVKIAEINGKMKQTEIDELLNDFSNHKYDILVATTIIEVGVNVPNSTVILIKNSDRFGLATLHQLRGRVGRSDLQSYCILDTTKDETERLKVMTKTNDGFKIAEEDLNLRGMGDFIGTKQTGDNKAVMLMLTNQPLYNEITNYIKILIKENRLTRYLDILDEYNEKLGLEQF